MTSVIRTYAQRKLGLTKFLKPSSPTYTNGNNIDVLFPFTYNNGVLDITYNGNDFESIMVDVLNQEPQDEPETSVQILSGPYLVNSLGENFKNYIRSWQDGTIDPNSPINIYISPQVLLVQQPDLNSISSVTSNNADVYRISTQAPSSDDYIVGSPITNYNTTYIFKTPLTFTIVASGVTTYITFKSTLDQE